MNDNNIATYYVLDLDRTLLNTEAATEAMRGVLSLHNPDVAAALAQKFDEYVLLGESFSMREFIVEQVGEEEMQVIEAAYHHYASNIDLLNPGAKELIAYIRAKPQSALGMLTYGSALGQAMKIQAATGLAGIPYSVTSETYKAALIAGWRQDDDLYHIPEELGGFTAADIIFVDDKPFSFKGLPIDCRGYLVKTVYDAGIEKLPLNVMTVTNLYEVVSAEKKRQ